MNYLTELRNALSLTQVEMAEFFGLTRSNYSMIEKNHRRHNPIKFSGLDQLARIFHLAQTAPDPEVLETVTRHLNRTLIAELIAEAMRIEELIVAENDKLNALIQTHEKNRLAYLTLCMMEKEQQAGLVLTPEKQEWLAIQLREARKRLSVCCVSQIYLKEAFISSLYTQLDRIRILLKSE